MWRMRGSFRFLLVALGATIAAGCATTNQTGALVVFAAGAALVLSEMPDTGWDAKIADAGERRFRIEIRRIAWTGSGEGDFGRRFDREAERVVSEHGCSAYIILTYRERYEAALTGGSKVAEGIIECA